MSTPRIQPRVAPGIPTGGQFSEFTHAESGVTLTDAPPASRLSAGGLSDRVFRLRQEGYVEPLAVSAGGAGTRSSEGRSDWWTTHFVTAEYNHAVGDYPQMPDDFTPRRTLGAALSGNRRTHRMAYSTADGSFALRMPSATSIKAFEQTSSGTFDVPVSTVDRSGNSVSGWVRVTKSGRDWTATELGDFGEQTGAQVSEAVSAVLEARRPSRALAQVGDLLERHKQRIAERGVQMVPVRSTFIGSVGYDEEDQTLAVAIRDRLYGYQVPRAAFTQLTGSDSPGKVYNALVKGNTRTELGRCDQCGRFFAAGEAHTCPTGHKDRPGQVPNRNAGPKAVASAMSTRGSAAASAGAATAATSPALTHPETGPAQTPARESIRGAQHADPPAGTRSIDLRAHLIQRGRGQMAVFGSTVPKGRRRGWTTDHAVADSLGPYTSSQYVPERYQSFAGTTYTNGDMGLVYYNGLRAQDAVALLTSIPRADLQDRQNDSPTTGAMLRAAAGNPGLVELGGYVVGPDREDERVSVESMMVYSDTDLEPEAAWDKLSRQLGLDAIYPPSEMSVESNPWRPAEKSWRFWWD